MDSGPTPTATTKPLTARNDLMLQFALCPSYTPVDVVSGHSATPPEAALVGRQTRRNIDLVSSGRIALFTVHFQPTGFYRLFRLPQTELTDRWCDAHEVLGRWVGELHDALRTSRTPFQMAELVETALLRQLDRALPAHPVEAAARLIVKPAVSGVAAVAATQQISVRQLERAFLTQVGVAPTLLGRIARFTRALEMKSSAPHLSWADVAARAGYYDQMHLVHDSHRFGGAAPSVLAESWIDCRADGVLDRMSHSY